MKVHSAAEKITNAGKALDFLKEGNKRYLEGNLCPKDGYCDDRQVLKNGQQPFAVVLCCSDSRVAPEIFFDQKFGDIFVVRNAGNIVDETVLGSIEYAVEHLGSPLVVICGHSSCGAVTAACGQGELPPNILSIANRIRCGITQHENVDDAAHQNVHNMAQQVRQNEIVKHMGAQVQEAFYDVHSGVVTWL